MTILNSRFIGGRTTIGIVLIQNETGQQSARIATVEGHSQKSDKIFVGEWGAKLSYEEAKGFFPDIEKEKYKHG